MDVAALSSWEIPGLVTFEEGPGGLAQLKIRTPLASALIYLHGAHVAEFQPAGGPELLFMSAASQFAADKPLRGGVPVIFPWFGGRADRPELPAHGFARTNLWEIESVARQDDGAVAVVLKFSSNAATREVWPHDFVLRHRITVGTSLVMTLEVENPSASPFEFEEAFHTYFAVSDVRGIQVSGLEGAAYIDKLDALRIKVQDEPITIRSETEQVYPGNAATCEIADPGAGHRIVIGKSGSASTVVWNPWVAKSIAMPDFGDEEWPAMMCIETANIAENRVTLAPGATHRMTAEISVTRSGDA